MFLKSNQPFSSLFGSGNLNLYEDEEGGISRKDHKKISDSFKGSSNHMMNKVGKEMERVRGADEVVPKTSNRFLGKKGAIIGGISLLGAGAIGVAAMNSNQNKRH